MICGVWTYATNSLPQMWCACDYNRFPAGVKELSQREWHRPCAGTNNPNSSPNWSGSAKHPLLHFPRSSGSNWHQLVTSARPGRVYPSSIPSRLVRGLCQS
jgi:hypothetical protein